MTKAEKEKLIKLSEQIDSLSSSIINVAGVANRTLDVTADLKESLITVLHRLNEVELAMEVDKKEPLVMPAEAKAPQPKYYKRRFRKKSNPSTYLFRYIKKWIKNNAPA